MAKKKSTPKQQPPRAPKAATPSKKVLHIEGGPEKKRRLHPFFKQNKGEWTELRLDPDPALQPDYIGTLRDLSAVPDQELDGIWCNQKMQLLFLHEAVPVMKECFRILKTGGVFMLSVPNVTRAAQEITNDRLEVPLFTGMLGGVAAIDILHGHRRLLEERGDPELHRCSFSASTIAGRLGQAGFRNVQVRIDNFVLWVAGSKLAADHPAYNAQPTILDYSRREKSLPDELDVPPMTWKPLGLKKAS